jgi:hypothetical protein
MPPAGFETTTPESEQQQTHALDRATTGLTVYYSIKLQQEITQWLVNNELQRTWCHAIRRYISTGIRLDKLR